MIAKTHTIPRWLLARSDVEHAWTLVGATGAATCRFRRTRPRSGSPATVTADGAWTLGRPTRAPTLIARRADHDPPF